MFWKRRKRITASDLAELLHEECVVNVRIQPPRPEMPPNPIAVFEEKVKLFQLAAVISVLRVKEEKTRGFSDVLAYLEALVFPPTPTDEGLQLLSNINSATSSLLELLFPEDKRNQLSWARNWLLDIGIDESNPAVLSLFSLQWMTFYTTLLNIVQEFNPKV